MKNYYFILLTVFGLFLISCSEKESKKALNINQGYWKVEDTQANHKKKSEQENVLVYFRIDGNHLDVLLELNSQLHIIEKYPISLSDYKLTLYHPFETDKIISVIELDANGNFIDKKIPFYNGEIPNDKNSHQKG